MKYELWILGFALVGVVAIGLTGRLPEKPKPDERPQTLIHTQHPPVACDACHSKGKVRVELCSNCHDPMQELTQLDTERDAYFDGACGNCHPVAGALRRVRPGPDLREARMKLTREWTYRFLSEPWAWTPRAVGPHHLYPEKDPALMVAKTRALVTALCGNADRPAYVARSSESADRLLRGCTACHTLDRLGSKVGRPWLEAFLAKPHAHAADSTHPDPHWTHAEVALVADRLLERKDPVFEPRWPVLDRATVDATDKLMERFLPGSPLQSASQAKKEAALGVRLLQSEGCAGCHTMLGSAPAQKTITREPKKAERAHIAHYSAQPEKATAFASMLLRYAKSTYWPKPRLPISAEGAALSKQNACSACHATRSVGFCEADRVLSDEVHDFGLSPNAKAAVLQEKR